jgi:hypothetical protein
LISSTDFIPKQAKEFDLHLVEPFNQVMHLPLPHHVDAVKAFEKLEDPTQGWPLSWLVELMRYRFMALG